jgi:hypothetical protein
VNARRIDRLQECGPGQARTRLRHAQLYLQVAQTVLAEEAGEETTVATGNAVLAAIAASDALCCARAGERYRGGDYRLAADLLERVTGDRRLAGLLRDVLDLKDTGHYGLVDVQLARAKSAVRKAEELVTTATQQVR